MQFTEESIFTRASRRLDVTDGRVMDGMYGSKPGRIERVNLEYVLSGRSGEWKIQSISLGGTALKQDGSDSKSSFHQNVFTSDLHRFERWAWLVELVDRARPTSAPSFPGSFEGREF